MTLEYPIAKVDAAIASLRAAVSEMVAQTAMPIGVPPTLGSLMRSRRIELGLSLQEVADAAGFTKSHVWEMEKNRSVNPTVRALDGIATALRLPFVYVAHSALHTTKMQDQTLGKTP